MSLHGFLRLLLAAIDQAAKNLSVERQLIHTRGLVLLVEQIAPVDVGVCSLRCFEIVTSDISALKLFLSFVVRVSGLCWLVPDIDFSWTVALQDIDGDS